jgi:hypothetical protein
MAKKSFTINLKIEFFSTSWRKHTINRLSDIYLNDAVAAPALHLDGDIAAFFYFLKKPRGLLGADNGFAVHADDDVSVAQTQLCECSMATLTSFLP